MAQHSKIEWTDHTFNPWIGCTRISTAATGGGGCDNCYAAVSTPARAMKVGWGAHEPRHRTAPSTWAQPERWNDRHEAFFAVHGRRQRVFCASLADVFDNAVPDEWRGDLFRLIESTPHLDWLLLTKRIGNAKDMTFLARGGHLPLLTNMWLGATVVNQEEADRDIPKLLATPARVRFLSIEPMLGPVDLLKTGDVLCRCDGCMNMARKHPDSPGLQRIDWVICGGESGPHARPMHPDWARSLRDQCAAAGVPFFFKQWGEWRPICQGGGDWYQPLCRSRRHAGPDEDQAALDEVWGRACTVPELCLRNDGRHAPITEPGAWQAGTAPVHAFRVGKKAAGRLLDGRTHDEFPA